MLAAPTGRAAKRMSEVIGMEARTIHRLLEYNPSDNIFLRDEDYPLEVDLLVIDEVSMIDTPDETVLEMHVEVPPGQTLNEAHDLVSQLETNIQRKMPGLDEVITHIEPAQMTGEHDRGFSNKQGQAIKQRALALLRGHYPAVDWHHVRVYQRETGITVTMHAAFSEGMTVESAHRIIDQAETLLRSHIPQLTRVTIHAEPN